MGCAKSNKNLSGARHRIPWPATLCWPPQSYILANVRCLPLDAKLNCQVLESTGSLLLSSTTWNSQKIHRTVSSQCPCQISSHLASHPNRSSPLPTSSQPPCYVARAVRNKECRFYEPSIHSFCIDYTYTTHSRAFEMALFCTRLEQIWYLGYFW